MLLAKEASPSEKELIFTQVHSIWPHASAAEEHLRLRLASVQHQRATWFVGYAGGELVSSLGAYPYVLFGPEGRRAARIFGAVFTKENARRHGYAAQLIRWVMAHYAAEGVEDFALFSDIGLHYYQDLGFHAVPSYEWSLTVPTEPVREASELQLAPLVPIQAGSLGCAYGFVRSAADDQWVLAKQKPPLELVRYAGSDFWLLSRTEAGAYILLESNHPQDAAHWGAFCQLVRADAQRRGCRLAQGWWTASEAAPAREQEEIIPRDKEILMWMSQRGAIDAWSEALPRGGFRVFPSEHV